MCEILTFGGERSSSWTSKSIQVLLPVDVPEQMLFIFETTWLVWSSKKFFGMCFSDACSSFFCHLGMVSEDVSHLGAWRYSLTVRTLFFGHLVREDVFTLVSVNVSHRDV